MHRGFTENLPLLLDAVAVVATDALVLLQVVLVIRLLLEVQVQAVAATGLLLEVLAVVQLAVLRRDVQVLARAQVQDVTDVN